MTTKKLRPTGRERDIIRLHAEGKTRKQIAKAARTTDNHCWAVLAVFVKNVSAKQRALAEAIVERKRKEAAE